MSTANDGKGASSLKQRIISGAVLAPVVVSLILLGGWFFKAMIFVAALISLFEFLRLAERGSHKYLHYCIGTIYLVLCFAAYAILRLGYEQGAWLALVVILCVWASDVGAYFLGKTIGGPKMAPKLSPNKTWAGLCGAMFFCGLALVLLQFLGYALRPYMNTDLGLDPADAPFVFATGLLLGSVGQAGDLGKSFYKRRVGVKDSGQLIPGHGGLLDRIDALLLVSPAFLIILQAWL